MKARPLWQVTIATSAEAEEAMVETPVEAEETWSMIASPGRPARLQPSRPYCMARMAAKISVGAPAAVRMGPRVLMMGMLMVLALEMRA